MPKPAGAAEFACAPIGETLLPVPPCTRRQWGATGEWVESEGCVNITDLKMKNADMKNAKRKEIREKVDNEAKKTVRPLTRHSSDDDCDCAILHWEETHTLSWV